MPDAPSSVLVLLLALAFGYLLGSIPFGLLLTRTAGTKDIRSIGSGNIGATNVLRTGRKDLAAATLLLDALKGTLAVLAAGYFYGENAAFAAGLGAFLGHIAPVWLGFRGGKGVATFLGIALGLFWPAALAFAVVWLAAAYFTRYSSLSALMASVATVVAAKVFGTDALALLLATLAILLWIKHHANIRRLLDGTEGKIGAKG
ncbi:glycerol-3-phosphate 1-O-acyltransferase PlsY [Xanthobacter dioxanivorans]|uniref:Glycerol-3-phosphate acyltransferase n=1 Tax=Xanthobacter dioxanivorans TaxID=2528964 RepID=A0A974PKE1_9HYPH|nr:glycerol-3-phosphate 1-O-acyltransferase PlsY [Xanthobacter dioxanivorans]QRG05188.1 glycerol-3-phosphate 1-O-acyltransferase PlsY [Xanthobacter dioxanivorans]